MKKFLIPVLVISFLAPLAAEITLMQLFNADAAIGGYVYKGDASSLGGTANITYVPALRFSDRFSIIPTYYGNYRGTKDVQELAGGGTLFQQLVDNTLIIKPIYQLTETLKAKVKVSGKNTMLMETEDEKLGKGLFDHNKISGGAELEMKLNTAFSRALIGAEYFTVRFPNYIALPEKYGLQLSTDNKSGSGNSVLDFDSVSGYLESDFTLGQVFGRGAFSFMQKSFPEQNVVENSGVFNTGLKRADNALAINVIFEKSVKKSEALGLIFQLNYAFSYLSSNQNHYDIKKFKFIDGYYDYIDNSLTPYFGIVLTDKMLRAGLSLELGRRDYSSRPVQNAVGDYGEEKIYQHYITLGLNFSYPLTNSLTLKARSNFRNNSSNMGYEKTYSYNFSSFNYFAGIGYEF